MEGLLGINNSARAHVDPWNMLGSDDPRMNVVKRGILSNDEAVASMVL